MQNITADIFARIDMDVVLAYDSIDVYQNPKSKKEEIHAVYNGYTKFISREIRTQKEEAMHDREVCSNALLHLAGKRQENAYAGFRPAGKTTTA